jgi:NAD(P)-dependent dehydrogenase (short-subunit alcohol dehydrogenase family)
MEKNIQPQKHWNIDNIPNQNGKTVLITGGSSGIGLACTKALASKGAEIIILGRNKEKGATAINSIKNIVPNAKVEFQPLNLGDLSKINVFVNNITGRLEKLDILINNAGIMMPAKRELTADGFESQFGVNYLSHFALTGLLLPLLKRTSGVRVVTLTSFPAGNIQINFDNLQAEKKYNPSLAYMQSKLAALIFALHLQRISEKNKWGITSVCSHPGLSATNLVNKESGSNTTMMAFLRFIFALFPSIRQSSENGALPTLYAATDPAAEGGMLYGPDGFMELKGHPKLTKINAKAYDLPIVEQLWSISEKLTKVSYK